MSIYGDNTTYPLMPFQFDIIYNSESELIEGAESDGVLVGRYVLLQDKPYTETKYTVITGTQNIFDKIKAGVPVYKKETYDSNFEQIPSAEIQKLEDLTNIIAYSYGLYVLEEIESDFLRSVVYQKRVVTQDGTSHKIYKEICDLTAPIINSEQNVLLDFGQETYHTNEQVLDPTFVPVIGDKNEGEWVQSIAGNPYKYNLKFTLSCFGQLIQDIYDLMYDRNGGSRPITDQDGQWLEPTEDNNIINYNIETLMGNINTLHQYMGMIIKTVTADNPMPENPTAEDLKYIYETSQGYFVAVRYSKDLMSDNGASQIKTQGEFDDAKRSGYYIFKKDYNKYMTFPVLNWTGEECWAIDEPTTIGWVALDSDKIIDGFETPYGSVNGLIKKVYQLLGHEDDYSPMTFSGCINSIRSLLSLGSDLLQNLDDKIEEIYNSWKAKTISIYNIRSTIYQHRNASREKVGANIDIITTYKNDDNESEQTKNSLFQLRTEGNLTCEVNQNSKIITLSDKQKGSVQNGAGQTINTNHRFNSYTQNNIIGDVSYSNLFGIQNKIGNDFIETLYGPILKIEDIEIVQDSNFIIPGDYTTSDQLGYDFFYKFKIDLSSSALIVNDNTWVTPYIIYADDSDIDKVIEDFYALSYTNDAKNNLYDYKYATTFNGSDIIYFPATFYKVDPEKNIYEDKIFSLKYEYQKGVGYVSKSSNIKNCYILLKFNLLNNDELNEVKNVVTFRGRPANYCFNGNKVKNELLYPMVRGEVGQYLDDISWKYPQADMAAKFHLEILKDDKLYPCEIYSSPKNGIIITDVYVRQTITSEDDFNNKVRYQFYKDKEGKEKLNLIFENEEKDADIIFVNFKEISSFATQEEGIVPHIILYDKNQYFVANNLTGIGLESEYNVSGKNIVGRYNRDKENLLYAIGNGTSDSNRMNALEVYEDGKIVAPSKPIESLSWSNGTSLITANDLFKYIREKGIKYVPEEHRIYFGLSDVTNDVFDAPFIDTTKFVTNSLIENIEFNEENNTLDFSFRTGEELKTISVDFSKMSYPENLVTTQQLTNYVTKELLENKNYITLTELNNKNYITQNKLKDYVTRTEFEDKEELTEEEIKKTVKGEGYINTIYSDKTSLLQKNGNSIELNIDFKQAGSGHFIEYINWSPIEKAFIIQKNEIEEYTDAWVLSSLISEKYNDVSDGLYLKIVKDGYINWITISLKYHPITENGEKIPFPSSLVTNSFGSKPKLEKILEKGYYRNIKSDNGQELILNYNGNDIIIEEPSGKSLRSGTYNFFYLSI